jgi:hypothetical protein
MSATQQMFEVPPKVKGVNVIPWANKRVELPSNE